MSLIEIFEFTLYLSLSLHVYWLQKTRGWFKQVSMTYDFPLVMLLGALSVAVSTRYSLEGMLLYAALKYAKEILRHENKIEGFGYLLVAIFVVLGVHTFL